MSTSRAFAAGLCAAAALAAAGWFLRAAPLLDEASRRALDAEETARRARRQAADAEMWADTERGRTRELEDRIRELERAMQGPPPSSQGNGSAEGMPGHGKAATPPEEPDPSTWDRQRLNQEIERLTRMPATLANDAQFPKVVKALRARPGEGAELIAQILAADFPPEYVQTAAALAEALGDPSVKGQLLLRARRETDPAVKVPLLRALAVLPGDEVVPELVALLDDPASDDRVRSAAMRGLALRGHDVARKVAAGEVPGVAPSLRVRAIESLRDFAEREGWIDTALIPVFGKALLTADGEWQRRLAILGLEGFWSKEALPDLEKFLADPAAPADAVPRAKALAEGLRAGAPRPAGAGVPDRSAKPR